MKTNHALFATFAVFATGCPAVEDDAQRLSTKVAQIEVTTQDGSSTTIDRTDFRYEANRLKEVAQFENGTPDGTARMTYGAKGIERIEYVDKDGDRAVRSFTFANNQLTRTRYEVTGVSVEESSYTYDSSKPALQKEITETTTLAGEMPSTTFTRFEYDPQDRLEKRIFVAGDDTRSTELRYMADGQLERASRFDGNAHEETYSFTYTPELRIDEVVDTHNGRHEVTYDAEGRISQIRRATGSGTRTVRYTYTTGEIEGWSFSPLVPMAELFDLGGESYATTSPRHGSITIPHDIEPAPMPSPPPAATTARIEVQNHSSGTIPYVYLSPCSATEWGMNKAGNVIAPGGYLWFSGVAAGCWDAMAQNESRTLTWKALGTDVVGGQSYTWTLTDATAVSTTP